MRALAFCEFFDLAEQVPVLLARKRRDSLGAIALSLFAVTSGAMTLVFAASAGSGFQSQGCSILIGGQGLDVAAYKGDGSFVESEGVGLHEISSCVVAMVAALIPSEFTQLIGHVPARQSSNGGSVHFLNAHAALQVAGHAIVAKNHESQVFFGIRCKAADRGNRNRDR